MKVVLSCPTLCDLMDIQSMEFSRPEHWSGQPFPSPRDLPKPGIKPRSPALQADSLPAEPPGKPKNTEVGSLSLLQAGDLPDPGIEPGSHALQADSSPAELPGKPNYLMTNDVQHLFRCLLAIFMSSWVRFCPFYKVFLFLVEF